MLYHEKLTRSMLDKTEKTLRIGIFDSGSGGLAILNSLRKKIPYADFFYLCDRLFFPYGNLDEKTIVKRTVSLCQKLHNEKNLDLMVIACNTASTLSLEQMRKTLHIPIVGVVPSVKIASEQRKSKIFGVIATERTTESSYLKNLIKNFAHDQKILLKASPNLVVLSEEKISGKKISLEDIRKEVHSFLNEKNLDIVVLGCTHFSQVLPELNKIAPHIRWIDSTEGVTRRVLSLIPKNTIQTQRKPKLYVLSTKKENLKEKWDFSFKADHYEEFK